MGEWVYFLAAKISFKSMSIKCLMTREMQLLCSSKLWRMNFRDISMKLGNWTLTCFRAKSERLHSRWSTWCKNVMNVIDDSRAKVHILNGVCSKGLLFHVPPLHWYQQSQLRNYYHFPTLIFCEYLPHQ